MTGRPELNNRAPQLSFSTTQFSGADGAHGIRGVDCTTTRHRIRDWSTGLVRPSAPRGVIDARTTLPLRDVSVVVTTGSDTVGRAATDTSGAFELTSKAGPTSVHFVRPGYRSDSIDAAVGEFPLRVAMAPTTPVVANAGRSATVRDSAAHSGFEQRARRTDGGAFIKAADIAKRKPAMISDLFRSRPGVRIDDSAGVRQIVSLRASRQAPSSSGVRRCVLRLAENGHLMPAEFSVDDVRPEDVQGIEIYLDPASIPVEFSNIRQDAPCGIVIVWTKMGSKP